MPDRGVKENTICSMCVKKEPDQEGDDKGLDGKSVLITLYNVRVQHHGGIS